MPAPAPRHESAPTPTRSVVVELGVEAAAWWQRVADSSPRFRGDLPAALAWALGQARRALERRSAAPEPPPESPTDGARRALQVRIGEATGAWLDARSAATGQTRSDLVREALARLDRYADAYSARPALLARLPWALPAGAPSCRLSVRITPAERNAAELIAERFADRGDAGAAVRMAVFIAAAEAAEALEGAELSYAKTCDRNAERPPLG